MNIKITNFLTSKKFRITILIIILMYFILEIIAGYISFNIIFNTKEQNINYKKEIDNLLKNYNYYDEDYKKIISFFISKYKDAKKINIKSFDNFSLNGYILENKMIQENNNWVIISHGYRNQIISAEYFLITFILYSLGFNILLIEHRAHGLSEVKYSSLGYKERLDIKEWIKYIAEKYPNSAIATYGLSMGATAILLACGEELPKNFKLCIADSAFNSCYDTMNTCATNIMHIPKIISKFILNGTYLVGKIIYNTNINFNTEDFLKKSNYPILFIHGDNDSLINYKSVERKYKNYKGDKEILIIKNSDHCSGLFLNSKLYFKSIKNFTRKYMDFNNFDKISSSTT